MSQPAHVFFKPMSCLTFYIFLTNGLSLDSKKEDTISLDIAKKIARFVLTAFGLPFFTVFFIFYNSIGMAIKGTCAVISATKESFFDHTFDDYSSDLHQHIAFAIKDFAINYFVGFLCIAYAFYSQDVEKIDTLISNKIEELIV